jgi:hypothetical protein
VAKKEMSLIKKRKNKKTMKNKTVKMMKNIRKKKGMKLSKMVFSVNLITNFV